MSSSARAAKKLGTSIPSVSVPVSDVSDRIMTITIKVQVSVSVWVGSVSIPISVVGTAILWGREAGIGCSSRGTIWRPVVVGTGTAWWNCDHHSGPFRRRSQGFPSVSFDGSSSLVGVALVGEVVSTVGRVPDSPAESVLVSTGGPCGGVH